MSETGLKRRLRTGYIVFGVLVGIKIAEYLIATSVVRKGAWPYLAVLAAAGAWLILYYFKHIYRLWRSGSRDDE